MRPLIEGALTVVGLVVLLMLALALGLWAAWKRRNDHQQADWLQRISRILRNPWQSDDPTIPDATHQALPLKDNEPIHICQDKPSANK